VDGESSVALREFAVIQYKDNKAVQFHSADVWIRNKLNKGCYKHDWEVSHFLECLAA
jgi:hypothetical protein